MTKNEYQREYRRRNGNRCTRRYEKTPKGFLVRTYRNMLSRVTGVLVKKAHLYAGLDILPKQDFYQWALSDSHFHELYATWVANNYNHKLTPSIDRRDATVGYVPENIRWLTHSQNSAITRRAA